VYLATVAAYGQNDSPPSDQRWRALLSTGTRSPKEHQPTPRGSKGRMIYSRVSGVQIGSTWTGSLSDPGSNTLNINESPISWPISSLERGDLGTNQVQTAELKRFDQGTAWAAHGNYGVEYDLTLPLSNPERSSRTVAIALESPDKRGSSNGKLQFKPGNSGPVMFRGPIEMKLALLLNVIDPRIGGVMIMGDRGTGKSTTIRALADLLPGIEVVEGDPYNSSPTDPDLQSSEVRQRLEHGEALGTEQRQVPMVDLPLGATEDRLCGTIDIEKALSEGVRAFEPGLLAKANRGLLYVDEVNLLDDHLVDVLLDSAASGWNTVEREGVSVRHPARFVLIGSGNPEEGELRPQLLDRFGMSVEVRTVRDPQLRVKVVDQRTAFDSDPDAFSISVTAGQEALQARVVEAQQRLEQVTIDDDLRLSISSVCGELDVDGLRGDIVTNRAARALAAFEGRTEVSEDDVARVVSCCLRHRLRKDPLEQIDSGDRVVKMFCKVFERNESDDRSEFELALAS
jgi:magnesium chelatase subunit I